MREECREALWKKESTGDLMYTRTSGSTGGRFQGKDVVLRYVLEALLVWYPQDVDLLVRDLVGFRKTDETFAKSEVGNGTSYTRHSGTFEVDDQGSGFAFVFERCGVKKAFVQYELDAPSALNKDAVYACIKALLGPGKKVKG